MSISPARFADAPMPAKSRSARLLWAMLMSLFTAGLGHVYLGRFRTGLKLVAADIAIDLAGTALMHRPPTATGIVLMALVLLAVLALRITAVVLVARAGAPTQSLRKPVVWQNAWMMFALVLAVTQAAALGQPSVLRSFSIPSGSMIPTLQVGDLLFADLTPSDPARGDIVFFPSPADPAIIYVKRIIALPGDRVQMQAGRVVLNGQTLSRSAERPQSDQPQARVSIETLPDGRSYSILKLEQAGPLDDTPDLTIPPGQLFVLGDNRDNALDSRLASFGLIPIANIVAHGGLIYWAQDRSRILSPVR